MRLEEMLGAPVADKAPPRPPEPEIPGQMTVEECVAEAEQPQATVEVTPSGTPIYYQWAPKRLYRIHPRARATFTAPAPPDFFHTTEEELLLDAQMYGDSTWQDVPSVTTVLGVLEKPALVWWGMKVGIEGMYALADQDLLCPWPETVDEAVTLLTEHKLTVNHVKDKAADRGVNVHDALESWCKHGVLPIVEQYPEAERGYIDGLCAFLTAIRNVAEVDGMEVMVGSLEHLYAGRFDLVLNISKPVEVVTKCYPKRADKVEEIPAGRYLLDLKTSKRVYPTHFLQLEAYEKASVECGYAPTDHRGVVHVTADGKYELALNTEWQFEDFLAVRGVYTVLHEREKLAAEREIESALRTELGARGVA